MITKLMKRIRENENELTQLTSEDIQIIQRKEENFRRIIKDVN